MGRTRLAKASIKELKQRIEISNERKAELIKYLHELWNSYQKGLISSDFYVETAHRHFEGKTLKEWISFYEHYIKECEREIKKHQKNRVKTHLSVFFFAILIIFVVFMASIYIRPELTGFLVQEAPEVITDANATITTTQHQATLGQPVRWTKTVSLDKPTSARIRLPLEATNISVNKITESYSEEINQEVLLKEDSSPSQEEPLSSSEKQEASFSMTGGVIGIEEESRILGFLRNIAKLTGRVIEEPSQEIEINDTATEYEIEYFTDAPYAIEEEIERGKRVKIVGPETIHYENVLAFTELPKEVSKNFIKLYRTTGGIRESVQITNYIDENNNNLIDKIEWVVPHLSNQTYELIIEISKAEHLDSNREFISDIYNEVRALDDVWSETIPNQDYVRVVFEQELDFSRDLTLYLRIVSGNPRIEVYEINGTGLIAEFTNINSNQYNKVYLTNLQGSQDVFDLRVLDGDIEIDYIVDPEKKIGYEFLDDGKVVHIWNTQDDYFFDKDSGIQLTNHYEDYWTKNVFCIGYYSGGTWNKINCADELKGFTKSIETDNQTYVNATLWKDISYGNYDLRLGINYYLGLDDENLSITIYGKNIGIDIPFDLGFAWRLTDIKIDNTYENDYIKIWNNTGFPNYPITTNLASELHENYTNLNQTKIEMIEGSKYLRLSWNENLQYKLMIDSNENQYNAPVTLLINAGLFNSGVEKTTTMYWIDAITNVSVSSGTTADVWDDPLTWNHDIVCGENMVLIVGVATDGPDAGVYIDTVTYNGTSLTKLGAIAAGTDVDVEMWNLTDPDCGNSEEINVTYSEDSAEEAAGISTVYYGVDYIDNSTIEFNFSLEGDYSTLGVTTTSADEIVVDVFAVDNIDAATLYGGDNQTQRGMIDQGIVSIYTSDAYDSDGTTKIGWEIDGDEFAHIAVALIPTSVVEWNQSSHDFGETITNATTIVEISSFKINTGTKVDCTGNCTEITTNWTQRTMSDGQSDAVLITCSNATAGVFNATFNVTSDEDASSNLLTVDCEVWSYGWLNVSIQKPDDNSEWYQNDVNLTVNATVICEGGSNAKCGTVEALARYNLTASPDTAINTTEGGEPFFVVGGGSGEPIYQENANATACEGTWESPNNLCVKTYDGDWDTEGHAQLDVDSYLYINYTKPIDASNTSEWQVKDGAGSANLTIPTSCWSQDPLQFKVHSQNWYIAVNEHVFWYCWDGDGFDELLRDSGIDYIEIYEEAMWWDIPGVNNPQSTILNKDDSYQFNWTVNVTSGSTESYLIDVFFNSTTYYPSITENDTEDRQVNLNPSEDTIPPKWFDTSTNGTTAGTYIEHRVRWTDTALSGYIFEFDNGTGTFNNDSFVTFTGTNNWSNVTKYVNETEGSTIRWRVYANDTASPTNWNATDIFQYDTTSANNPPTIGWVESIDPQTPVDDTIRSITFNFTVTDQEGASDINVSTAQSRFQLTDEATRSNLSCVNWSQSGNNINFTCTIDMWYFDKADTEWEINVTIKDINDASGENSSTKFQYNPLMAMKMSPTSLEWPEVNLTNIDIGSNNDPILINNTGNDEPLNINVTAFNLQGEEYTSYYIYAANFTVENATEGCSGAATAMSNATSINVTSAILYRGNHSLGYKNATSGQEELFFCLKEIPSENPAQSYSSAAFDAWEIRILLVAVIPATRRRKKKLKKRKEITENLSIPTTIFSENIGALETVIKYLRENLGMNYHEIARYLNRDERTIWTAYQKAVQKQHQMIEVKETKMFLPISILRNRKLTVLESIVVYLKEKEMKYSDIAKLVDRDQRNIWTIYFKAIKKIEKKEIRKLVKIKVELNIPSTIFSKELGALETISKYMKENLGMSYHEIARELGRNERTIWTAYNKAKKKQPESLEIAKTKMFLPISIFENKEFTILESIILYLKEKGFKFSGIAKLLDRDQRNIWTIYSRTKKKLLHKKNNI